MQLRFKLVLFSLFLIVVLSYATTESELVSEKIVVPPHKNVRSSVIDGTGTDGSFGIEDTNNGMGEKKSGSKVSVSTVALFTLAMAAATGLGAVPFFFVELDPQWAGLCNGMAAGVMLAASFDLIQEGQEHGSGNWVVFGILAGGIFIWLCKQVIYFYAKFEWKYVCSMFLIGVYIVDYYVDVIETGLFETFIFFVVFLMDIVRIY